MADCCDKIKALLGDYLDEALEPELCRELEHHLGDCEPCRVVVDTTRRTLRFYCEHRPVDLPEEVEQRLKERLRKELLS